MANSKKADGPKELVLANLSFAALASPAVQKALAAGGFDVWKLVIAMMMLYYQIRQTGQHGPVDLKLLAILPDGTPIEFDMPDVTI